ncbi:helix-turn-helix domain-containing protein [Arenicella xantha]|uniref:Helix-turn-helix protein n=1 Tax=Arenicella xantha TaxID=644221 RepID=A0A395JNV8_9GAMM|nr:helix-turn-helix transcriptional regulator [Arenicella xantha]RBP51244.1 helix-turn-helix protein [Arenicella xantha]
MKISHLSPDKLIQQELGARLQKIRKQYDYTQTQLAEAAGIGVATLRRIEDGKDSQLSSWIKLMKALEMSNAIDQLLPESFNSPMAEALSRKRRSRASDSPSPIWRDELK